MHTFEEGKMQGVCVWWIHVYGAIIFLISLVEGSFIEIKI